MFKNLVANLFAHGEITTTVAKAKELRRLAERVITRAKRCGPDVNKEGLTGEPAMRRMAVKRDLGKWLPRASERLVDGETERLDVVEHLFREVAPMFMTRAGGYTQTFKLGNRRGDNAEMALIRLVGFKKPKKAATVAAPEAAEEVPVTEAVRTKAPKSKSAGA